MRYVLGEVEMVAFALLFWRKFGGYILRRINVCASVDMDISMDIHGKSVDMDMNKGGKFYIHGKPAYSLQRREPIFT